MSPSCEFPTVGSAGLDEGAFFEAAGELAGRRLIGRRGLAVGFGRGLAIGGLWRWPLGALEEGVLIVKKTRRELARAQWKKSSLLETASVSPRILSTDGGGGGAKWQQRVADESVKVDFEIRKTKLKAQAGEIEDTPQC